MSSFRKTPMRGKLRVAIILGNLGGDFIQSMQNDRLIKQDALEIALHRLLLGHCDRKRSTHDCFLRKC